jgi:hypothetical protein
VARYRVENNDPTNTAYLRYNANDLPNPKLRWEKTSTFNVGLDFRLFNNILSGSLEFYNRVSDDLLVTKILDSTLGTTSRVINNGKIRNRGIEFSLTGNILRKKDWNLSANLNFAYNNNTVMRVDQSSTTSAVSYITSPTNYFVQGTSYNTLWAYRLSRVVNGYPVILDADGNEMATFDADGNPTWVNQNTMYGTDALENCGSLIPKYNGSLSLNLRWKDLELNTLFIFAGGHKLRMDVADMSSYEMNTTHILDPGVKLYYEMPTTIQQYASTFAGWWKYCNQQVKSADYLKMRSINLAYHLPQNIIKKLHIGDTRFTFQISNLFTWCAAGNDIDPEAYSPNSGTRSLPQPTTYSFGLSTSF